MMHRLCAAPAALILSMAGLACHAESQLEPARTAQSVPGMDEAIVATNNNVRLVAQPDAWTGEARITEEVTPLRVIIQNDSDRSLSVRYEDFQLIAADGSRYRALPPSRIEGEVPVTDPLWTYSGFEVAPYYGAAYPGFTAYSGPFYDPTVYYDTYYDYWETELPTYEMRARAMPEGVLNAGGRIDGMLYFQKVEEPDDSQVTLEAKLSVPQTQTAAAQAGGASPFAVLTLPFEIED